MWCFDNFLTIIGKNELRTIKRSMRAFFSQLKRIKKKNLKNKEKFTRGNLY